MSIITALTPEPRRPGRWAVVVDGRVVARVSLEMIERLGLRVGRAFDDVAAAVEAESAAVATFDRALDMLARRGRSRAELRRLLIRKGEPADAVDRALEALATRGFLDDARYARDVARSRLLGAPVSRRRLSVELGRKGVARDVADEAIEEVLDEEGIGDADTIRSVARKRLGQLRGLDPATRRRRLYAFLARRGYASEDIRRAMDLVLPRDDTTLHEGPADQH